jgi:uncharacterized protein (TIGR03435 family)
MSENLFRLLLRLYPSHFRDSYGDEALQLFRNRFHDEKGPWAKLRLWVDLVSDFVVTVPYEYLRPKSAASVVTLQKSPDGAPALFVLRDAPPSTKSLLLGTIVTILALLVLSLSPAHTRRIRYELKSRSNERSPRSAGVSADEASPALRGREASDQAAAFVSIEVKPARSRDPQSLRLRVLSNGDLVATSVNAITLISEGYEVPVNPSDRLSAVPSWALSERYDIEAKASPTAKRVSPSDMFREVLSERFHIAMQTKSKSMPVYALVVAQGGSRLKQAAPSDCIFDTAADGCHTFVIGFGHPLNARAVSMDDLAHYIENWTDLPVVNRTSLAGVFTTSTDGWKPMRLPPPPPNVAGTVDFTRLPTIDTVLGNLGLKLEKASAQLPVCTLKQISRP